MNRLIAALTFALLASCATTLADYKKPSQDEYFGLDKDHTRTRLVTLRNIPTIEGLRAGTYTLVAESPDGFYFQGPYDCVFMLRGASIENYQRTGEIPPLEERLKGSPISYNGVGGIWLPKPGVRKEPKLFFGLHNTSSGSGAGAIGTSIVSMTEGDLLYLSFGTEAEFFAAQQILVGVPPAPDSAPAR